MQVFPKTKKEKAHAYRQAGFTLLIAALVVSVALALGSSIYTIVSKELALSSVGQDSQYAFYAADTAAECALYWDSRTDEYPNTFATSSTDKTANPSAVTCDNVKASSVTTATNAGITTTEFELDSLFEKGGAGGYCADVSVEKSKNGNTISTLVIANGFSVSCQAINGAPDALQRTVELQY